jgi:hypothetical protein
MMLPVAQAWVRRSAVGRTAAGPCLWRSERLWRNGRITAMTHMALTADEEIRRIQRLGEAKHDWCEACPTTTAPPRLASVAQSVRTVGAAQLRTISRPSPKSRVTLTAQGQVSARRERGEAPRGLGSPLLTGWRSAGDF